MREPRILRDQIEQNRQELLRLVEEHGMHNYKVLQQSRILDELINEYNRYTSVVNIKNKKPWRSVLHKN